MPDLTCAVDGCDKEPRTTTADWCKMHYHRWYRHGSTDKVATRSGITVSKGRRYKSLYLPGHPLASKHGRVYAHRAVLYDTLGAGPHHCHWCDTELDWLPKGHPMALNVDHLNGLGDDNRPENLVPSCPRCNSARAIQQRSEALRRAGWWSNNDTVAVTSPRRPKIAVAADGF